MMTQARPMHTYRFVNGSQGTILALQARKAATVWSRLRGLIGTEPGEFSPGQGLWLVPANWIHTFGLRFPIDVVYLDAEMRIVDVAGPLRPGRIAPLKLKARSVLELPAGTLEQTHTRKGDRVVVSRSSEPEAGGSFRAGAT